MNPQSQHNDEAAFQHRYEHLRKFFNAVDTQDPCSIESIDMNNETTLVQLRCDDQSVIELQATVSYDSE